MKKEKIYKKVLRNILEEPKRIEDLIKFIEDYLYMTNRNLLTKENKRIIFKNRKTKLYNEINFLQEEKDIDPQIYYNFQITMHKITGRYWKLKEIAPFFIYWFVYNYSKNPKEPKGILPFRRLKKKENNKKINKFEILFEPYYKNILGSWGER